jgi:chromosome segregation ATPase
MDNSYLSSSTTPILENNSYESGHNIRNENSELIKKINEQKEQIKNLQEELKFKTKENNSLNNQISEFNIKIEDITHKYNLELSKMKMGMISEKSKLDSQMSDVIHKCSLYESTLKNKDKIIDDLKIQLEVLNEGTSQKLKSLDDENKKNIQFYNNVQAELISAKKEIIQQKQNYEIEIHNLKSEIEKIQELSSHEKKEASMEKERLEKDKSNLKKKINEILNEKDILKNNIERKDKQIKEIEKTIETNNKKNEILKKKNTELEHQLQLNSQEKNYTKKKYCKELMKIKKISEEFSNSLENEQKQHHKDILTLEEKNKTLIDTIKKMEIQNDKKCNSYISKIESQNKIIQEYEIRLTELEHNMIKLKNQYEKEIEKKRNKIKEVEKKSRAFFSYIQNQTNGLL